MDNIISNPVKHGLNTGLPVFEYIAQAILKCYRCFPAGILSNLFV